MKLKILFLIVALTLLAACGKIEDDSFMGKACQTDADCFAASCCHASACVNAEQRPDCSEIFCSQECQPGTMDCGGGCFCNEGVCDANLVE